MKKKAEKRKKESDSIELVGEISKIMNGMMYRVKLENGMDVLGFMSGKMRQFNIRIGLGDRVKIEMSPYDLTKGRITYRIRQDFGSNVSG